MGRFRFFFVFFLCCAVITFALIPFNPIGIPFLKEGQKSPVDVRSPYTLRIKDTKEFEKRKKEAEGSVKPVFRIDSTYVDQLKLELKEISDSLKRYGVSTDFIVKLLSRYYVAGVIPDDLSRLSTEVILEGGVPGGSQKRLISSFYTLSELKRKFKSELVSFFGRDKGIKIFTAVHRYLSPNVRYDKEETGRKKREKLSLVKPVYYSVKKGELVVKKGERVSGRQEEILMAIRELEKARVNPEKYIVVFLMVAFVMFVIYKLYNLISPTAAGDQTNYLFSFTVITLDVVMIKLFSYLFELIASAINLPVETEMLYIPVVTSTIFASMFITKKVAVIHSFPVSVIPSLTMVRPALFIVPVLLGSILSCFDSRRYKSRNVIYKSAFLAAAGIAAVQVLCLLKIYNFKFTSVFVLPILAFVGAVISGVIVNGLIPVFGHVFGFATDMFYMELVNLNHPLLRKLILKAPGTYNHSIMVSTLSEAAAETIGANSLLARVGGLYHDIGKLKNPKAFVENQDGINVHERLSPEKSAAILRSHIEFGEELARKYGLPRPIIDIVKEHHGTKIMEYFYGKAIEKEGNVDERKFRYPGPKPRFKEAAIVMLADTVEAAVRSFKGQEADLASLVHRLIMKEVEDGQLNQSGLTLKELGLIERVFVKILAGVYHERVEYPDVSERNH